MPLEMRLLAAETAAPVVVADFDYSDSSEEVADQRAQHAARVRWYPTHGEAFARRDGAPPHHIGAQHVEHRIAGPRGKRRGGDDQGE